jgi:hypothetical protein
MSLCGLPAPLRISQIKALLMLFYYFAMERVCGQQFYCGQHGMLLYVFISPLFIWISDKCVSLG